MPDRSFTIFMLLKPLGVGLGLFLIYGFMWLLWKHFPEGKIKRALFFNFWGGGNDPWTLKYQRKPKDVHLGRIVPEAPPALPQSRSPEADPPPSSPPPQRRSHR